MIIANSNYTSSNRFRLLILIFNLMSNPLITSTVLLKVVLYNRIWEIGTAWAEAYKNWAHWSNARAYPNGQWCRSGHWPSIQPLEIFSNTCPQLERDALLLNRTNGPSFINGECPRGAHLRLSHPPPLPFRKAFASLLLYTGQFPLTQCTFTCATLDVFWRNGDGFDFFEFL